MNEKESLFIEVSNAEKVNGTLKFSSVNPSSVLASLIIAATYRFTRFLKTS